VLLHKRLDDPELIVYVLYLWTMANPDPYRYGTYATMNACRYDLPKVREWAEAEGQTHIAAGCAATPLAPYTSLRPEERK
jgi:hypothetical protein